MQVANNSWHLYSMGLMEYQEALCFQHRIAELRCEKKIPDALILVEHPHTYTLGPRSDSKHFFVSAESIKKEGIAVHQVERGGEITYHGPGQLVGYPIMQLEKNVKQVGVYISKLEDMLLTTLQLCGLQGRKRRRQLSGKSMAGVWVNDVKVASIGIKVNRHRITSHGFALNINTDLSYFKQIVPCGVEECRMASIAEIMGCTIPMESVVQHLKTAFTKVFHATFIIYEKGRIA